jgi:HNH endonuclease
MARATTNGPDSLVSRFWAKVDRRGGDECWPWRGHVAKGNAGRLSRGGRGGGMVSASRLAWELHNGPVPSGLQVIHECPSAWCVNPRHLFAGTAADRGAALVRKGNSRFGERHFNAKLDAATVKRIRAALVQARRPSVTEVARRFGLAKEHVSAIWKFKIWGRVGGRVLPVDDVRARRPRRRKRPPRPQCPDSMVSAIREMKGGIFSRREVALLFGVGASTVGRIWRAAADESRAYVSPRQRRRA